MYRLFHFLTVITLCFPLFMVSQSRAQESGEVIITEIMYDPQSSETTTQTQYIEIANTTPNAINLNGWTIDDEDSDGPNTLPDVTLPPYGIAVICGGTQADFEGAWGSGYLIISLKDDGQTMFNMSNSPSSTSEIIQLRDNNGNLVDEVNYDDASPWPSNNDQSSIYLNIPKDQMNATSNNDGANWALSVDGVDGARTSVASGVWSGGDVGSPGNILGDNALPVSLSLFRAMGGNGQVTLEWVTESEVNNVGFEIWRSESPNGQYTLLSSYRNNPDLQGQFNSNTRTRYQYVDHLVRNEVTYYYKLIDVSGNGQRTEHGPIHATPTASSVSITTVGNAVPTQFYLHPNYPNPFNPSTTIKFEVGAEPGEMNAVPVTLTIFNASGQRVNTLFSGNLLPGVYEMQWTGQTATGVPLPGGIYFLNFRTPKYQRTVKMVLMK